MTMTAHLVAIHELPGFYSLHEGLMVNELLYRLRSTVRFDVIRARDKPSIDRRFAIGLVS